MEGGLHSGGMASGRDNFSSLRKGLAFLRARRRLSGGADLGVNNPQGHEHGRVACVCLGGSVEVDGGHRVHSRVSQTGG